MKLTKEDAEKFKERITYSDSVSVFSTQSLIDLLKDKTPPNGSEKPNSSIAVAVPPRPDGMNKTEAAYAQHLDTLQKMGEIKRWWFQPMKLRLADKTFYTPDFLIQTNHGELEFDEVKGWLRDDASVKYKCARELYPIFRWHMVKKVKGGWDIRDMPW